MAHYLLDTNAFSALMRGDPRVKKRLAGLDPNDRVALCTVVKGEVLYGLERLADGKRRRALEHRAACLFAAILCDPVPEDVAKFYARLKRAAERAGTPLDENDLWIAATAQAAGSVLVTSDRDFNKLPDLHIEDWAA